MKNTLFALLFATAVIAPHRQGPPLVLGEMVYDREEPPIQIVELPKHFADVSKMVTAEIDALIQKYATEFGVRVASMRATIDCEAKRNRDGTYDATAQSDHVHNGVREDSWGLSQINLPSNPEVTKEQAQDPEFSIRFMAKGFANDLASRWTCWRDLKAAGKI